MQSMLGGFAQYTFIFSKLIQNRLSLRAKSRGVGSEKFDQGADGQNSFRSVVPLGLGQVARPIGTGYSLLEQQCHGVLIGRKEFKERCDAKPLGEPFQGIFIAGQGLAVHENVVTGVIPFNNNV